MYFYKLFIKISNFTNLTSPSLLSSILSGRTCLKIMNKYNDINNK